MKNKKGVSLPLNTIIIAVLVLIVLVVSSWLVHNYLFKAGTGGLNPFATKVQCGGFNAKVLPAGQFDEVDKGSVCVGAGECDWDGDGESDEGTTCCVPDGDNPTPVSGAEERGCCVPSRYCE